MSKIDTNDLDGDEYDKRKRAVICDAMNRLTMLHVLFDSLYESTQLDYSEHMPTVFLGVSEMCKETADELVKVAQ